MATTVYANTSALGGTQLVVGPGATLALLVTPEPGEVGSGIKVLSGGSLAIFSTPYAQANSYLYGISLGSTWAGASLVALNTAGGYVLGSGEAVNIQGPAKYYLMAMGATTIVTKLVAYGEGF